MKSAIQCYSLGMTVCLLSSLSCAPLTPSKRNAVTLAPTAVNVPLERVHQDILDSRAPLPTVICLKSNVEQQVSARITLDVDVTATAVLLGPSGNNLGPPKMIRGGELTSLRGMVGKNVPSLCAELKAIQGWGMFTLEWRSF